MVISSLNNILGDKKKGITLEHFDYKSLYSQETPDYKYLAFQGETNQV